MSHFKSNTKCRSRNLSIGRKSLFGSPRCSHCQDFPKQSRRPRAAHRKSSSIWEHRWISNSMQTCSFLKERPLKRPSAHLSNATTQLFLPSIRLKETPFTRLANSTSSCAKSPPHAPPTGTPFSTPSNPTRRNSSPCIQPRQNNKSSRGGGLFFFTCSLFAVGRLPNASKHSSGCQDLNCNSGKAVNAPLH